VAKVLVVSPSYDDPTRRAAEWADIAISAAIAIGHDVVPLRNGEATRAAVEDHLASGVDLLLFYGHGRVRGLVGHGGMVILEQSNIGLLASTITYAVACKSGSLFADLVEEQASGATIIAYNIKVPVSAQRAYRDLFGAAATSVVNHLLQGDTCEMAAAGGRSSFTRLFERLDNAGDGESSRFAELAAECRNGLFCRGVRYARLRQGSET
jgi:hypothetical protein